MTVEENRRRRHLRSEQRKSEFLGIPYGTACQRLRKMLLFNLAKQVAGGTLDCWDCAKEITEPEELSIQHKKPWLHGSKDLFWDLDNVTFSHLKCNRPNRNRNAEKTHCVNGHEFTEENTRRPTGNKKQRVCRECEKAKSRKYMRKKRAREKAAVVER